MSDGIVLRLAVDSDALSAVLDRLPGVAVVDEPAEAATTDETDDGAPPSAEEAEPGRLAALVGEWGLLGLGVGLAALGVATAALWWTRRGAEDDTSEVEPGGADEGGPATTVLDAGDDGAPDDTAADGPADSEERGVDPGPPSPEPTTTDSGDHTERSTRVDSRSLDRSGERESEEGESGLDERDSGADEDVIRRGDVDPAPLVGAAFLAVVGVVVRWLGGDEEP